MKLPCFDNSPTNNPHTLFMQSFRGCHRADIHLEHVHPLCCPGALRMCHLCEDITRAGGGILHITSWPLKDSKTMPRYQAESKTPTLMKLFWLSFFCVWPRFFLQKSSRLYLALCLNLHWKMKPIMLAVPFIHSFIHSTLHTIERLVQKQQKHLNTRAYACWFSWPEQLCVHIETHRTKEIKTTWRRRLPKLNRRETISERDAIIRLKVILFCCFVLLHTVVSIAAHEREGERRPCSAPISLLP